MYNTMSYKLARGLGWFSVVLGATELLLPGALNRSLGLREHNSLVRGFGLREMAAGVGILTMKDPTPWVWARVVGDALDLLSLVPALGPYNPRRGSASTAFVSVAAITLLDVVCARALSEQVANRQIPRRDYSDRSGFRSGAEEARGMAGGVVAVSSSKRA